MTPTHDVFNQVPPLVDWNPYVTNRTLVDAVEREGAGWVQDEAAEFGELTGSAVVRQWAVLANRYPPELRTHAPTGERIDEVHFHPAWHELLRVSVAGGLHASPWADDRPGAHVARAAMFMTIGQAEAGHGCPISMTYSVVPSLRRQPELAALWEPRVFGREYDSRSMPADEKASVLMGMAMTEKQGGSDVRANTTRAEPTADGSYRLTGHKWFCSAPMCDAFLVLAQAPEGLTCFMVPRWTPDGLRNGFHLQRLKDKLGNRSNASSEVELDSSWAQRVGEEGRGVSTIIEMVSHTRLDCVLGSAAGMREAVVQAAHHATHRAAFGKALVEQPLMRNVLADLALETEAATLAAIRLAGAFDRREDAFRRIATPAVKYLVCKRHPMVVAEALECLGGNGYVEESDLPRLFRESPLNSIWEGSGNVQSLDVLRALAKEPDTAPALLEELESAAGVDPRYDEHLAGLRTELAAPTEAGARRLAESIALALQASLMIRFAASELADAFVASRLGGDHGGAFGTLPEAAVTEAALERIRP